MDSTTQAFLAALLGAIVSAAAVLAWALSDRQQHQTPVVAEKPVVPPEVGTVLSVLRSSAVVVDDDDQVVKASAPAYALGLVRGTALLSEELATMVQQVRRDGQIRETELTIGRPSAPSRHVTARVAPLGSRLVLALVEDRTRERRVEAVRRDFVANVSHELKTPVGAIRVLADAVADAADDPEAVRRFSDRMLKESDRLTSLVQQIIELSRLQGDEPPDSPTEVDVDEIVASAIDTSSVDAQARDIDVLAVGTQGLKVHGSEEQLLIAVTNLVANAVNYSDPGSSVTVATKCDRETVEISVVDQGIGIPQRDIDRIFERFYRVDPARHRSTGGTGLGLSIVKHVAATHGGEVKVWSVEGQGSTFTLSLPRHAPAQPVAVTDPERELPGPDGDHHTHPHPLPTEGTVQREERP